MQILFSCRRFADRKPSARLVVVLALGALLVAVLAARPAAAQSPDGLCGVAPAPAGTTAGRLTSETIDVSLEERRGRTVANVQAAFHILNSDPAVAQPITVSFPSGVSNGLTFAPAEFRSFTIAVDGKARQLKAPSAVEGITSTQSYSLVLTVPPEETSIVELTYSQDLGDGDRPAFRFVAGPASLWPGLVSSYRVTVRFPEATSLEQVLDARPDGPAFNGQEVTWYYTDVEPKTDILLSFISPRLWREMTAARLKVTGEPDAADAHYELAALYRRLAAEEESGDTAAGTFRALLIAELEAARRTADEGDPLLCSVHQELAEFSRERAHRPDGAIEPLHLSTLIDELERAREACPKADWDPAFDREIGVGYLELARLARRDSRFEAALQHLDSATRLDGVGDMASRLADERRLTYLGWIQHLFDRGDTTRAFQLATVGLQPGELLPKSVLQPRFSAVQAVIVTDAGSELARAVKVSLQSYLPWPAGITEALSQLKAALPSELQVTETLSGTEAATLEIRLPPCGTDDLAGLQQVVARGLPDWPELAVLRAALQAPRADWTDQDGVLTRRIVFREAVDLRPADTALQERQAAAEQERLRIEGERGAGNEEARLLQEVRRQVMQLTQDAWSRLHGGSRVSYETSWRPGGDQVVRRSWTIEIGQQQEMRLEAETVKWDSVKTVAALVVLFVLILVLVLLLVARLAR